MAGCEYCKKTQASVLSGRGRLRAGGAFFYRIGDANIMIVGCERHVEETCKRLDKVSTSYNCGRCGKETDRVTSGLGLLGDTTLGSDNQFLCDDCLTEIFKLHCALFPSPLTDEDQGPRTKPLI